MAERICHVCGQPMERGTQSVPFTYKGHSLTLDQSGWYCACGEGVHSPEDCEDTDASLELFRDRIDGILPPDEVRRIRKKLKLPQKRAGVVLGGGASAFQKYETRTGKPSLAMSNLLRLLDHDPNRLSEIIADGRGTG